MVRLLERYEPARDDWRSTLSRAYDLIMKHPLVKNQESQIEMLEDIVRQVLTKNSAYLPDDQVNRIKLWLGHQLEKLGAWDHALQIYKVVSTTGHSKRFSEDEANALRSMGNIQLMRSCWAEASESLLASLAICLKTGHAEGQVSTYNSLGALHFEQSDLLRAASYWHMALELAQKDNLKLSAQITNNLGALANVQGRWQQALAYYAESLPRFERIGYRRGLAETYHNIGMTYADAARWAEAGAL